MIQYFNTKMLFAIVIDGNIVMEAFTFISTFLGAYKLFQLYDEKGGLTFKDVLKFYARKYLRLAPLYYFCFFLGWAIFPKMGAGPLWFTASTMYTDC
jgi:peptidoglycan/LPS O-acetylase OafA/YrhL